MERLKHCVGFIVIVAFLVLGMGVSEGAEIRLRFAGNYPIKHHVTVGQELLAKLVSEKTHGKVIMEVYPAGTLYTDKDMMAALPSGAIDICVVTNDMWMGLVPSLMAFQLPLFYDDHPHQWRTQDGEAGEIMKRDLEKAGAKLIHWIDYGGVALATKFPVHKLEDIQGKRIRGFGETTMKYAELLGANPTFFAGGELYMALQRGLCEGALSGTTSFYDRKTYEVTKYLSIGPHMYTVIGCFMNLKKWNQLSPDIQKAILESGQEVQQWGRKESEIKDQECLELLKKNGMEVSYLSDNEKKRWREKSRELINIYIQKAGENGRKIVRLAEDARLKK